MAGETIELFSRTTFDNSGLAINTSTDQVMNAYVDVSPWTQGVLCVRLLALSLAASTEIRVIARPISLAAEDPQISFVNTSVSYETNLNVTGTPPTLLMVPLTANFGGGLRIFVRGVRGGTAGGSITATLSASLVMKD
jgi:hypothetical protein